MQLSNMRADQIDKLLGLVGDLLPEDQTVGATAVGGATVSVPNPAMPIVTALQEATGKYLEFSGNWIDKVESCQPNELEVRLDAFLSSQGF